MRHYIEIDQGTNKELYYTLLEPTDTSKPYDALTNPRVATDLSTSIATFKVQDDQGNIVISLTSELNEILLDSLGHITVLFVPSTTHSLTVTDTELHFQLHLLRDPQVTLLLEGCLTISKIIS